MNLPRLLFVSSLCLSASLRALSNESSLSRVAFGSCMHQDYPQPIWEAVLKQKPQLFIFLGDNIYADTTDENVMRQKYARLGENLGFQKLRNECRIMATWDDHDYGQDNAGGDFSFKKVSQRIFLDFWDVPSDFLRRKQEGIYSATVFGPPGQRIQVILLDTRYFRSSTMLGDEQWEWLEAQLKNPAELRLLCSSIQVLPIEHPFEKWADLPSERSRLLDLLKKTKVSGVVILSGDRHFAEVSVDNTLLPYPLYEMSSSSLNQTMKDRVITERNQFQIVLYNKENNFGWIEVDWDKSQQPLRFEIRNEMGVCVFQKIVYLDELK